jgi:hypothetical protein
MFSADCIEACAANKTTLAKAAINKTKICTEGGQYNAS